MVVGGLPVENKGHAEAIAEMAFDMLEVVKEFDQRWNREFDLRIGINTGHVVAGVIGKSKFAYDLWGDAVNTASRMESQVQRNKIQVTPETYKRLKDKYNFEHRGVIDIKGKGQMDTYFLTGRKQ